MYMKNDLKTSFIRSAQFILGLSLIISAVIFSASFYSSRSSNDVISVTGSASKEVVADNAKFVGNFSRVVKLSNLKAGYAQMTTDLKLVKDFLASQGILDGDVTISTVSMEQNWDYDRNVQTEKEFTLR